MKRKYIPLTQQPYCCVPACIQMVLLRRNLPLLSQEEIGYELGLIVPKKYKKILPRARTGKEPSHGWGTQVAKKEYSINNFFKKYKIPLKESYYSTDKIKNIEKWIKEKIKGNHDIITCFNYRKLYGREGKGHISILNSIKGKEVALIDPEYSVPKYRVVKLNKLIKAMESYGNLGGFWLIK